MGLQECPSDSDGVYSTCAFIITLYTSIHSILVSCSRKTWSILANLWCAVLRAIWPIWFLGLQQHTGVPVHRNIFCHDTNIVYWTSYHNTYDTFTYASTNMEKHCLQLVLTLLLLFSPYARRFSEQTDEKNPCWAVFSIIFKTRLVSCTDFRAHKQDTRECPSCFVVM